MRALLEAACDRRTFLFGIGKLAAAATASNAFTTSLPAAQIVQDGSGIDPLLAHFADRYIQEMRAPGMTLGLVHPDGHTTAAGFGLSDLARKLPLNPDMLFQIGSISKSFCAIALLQMRDEGKLDLHQPVLEPLPWLPIETPYGEITIHHLLTHSSGLPDNPPLFLSDRNARHRQGFKPGTQFHYSNLGFEILGHLAATLDGGTYAHVLQTRILDPLGMTATRPAISNEMRASEAQSYVLYRDDLLNARDARLAEAPRAFFDSAAGCVASTASDMARYMRMLLNRGQGPTHRIVSEESLTLFATPHIEAEEFGIGAHYGYGIAIDSLDGRKLLKHTGGMQSFTSSMQIDLDGGAAAFASVNTNEGYRPNPVTTYALRLMRARAQRQPIPAPEPIEDPKMVLHAEEYAGAYKGDAGEVHVTAQDESLFVTIGVARIRLQRVAGDSFVAEDEAWQDFLWTFLRAETNNQANPSPVTELMYGSRWYVNSSYKGSVSISAPKRFAPFEGTYDSGNDFLRVVLCKGTLFAGDTPQIEIGDGLFRASDEPNSPETLEFMHVVNGRARIVLVSGVPHRRIEMD